MSRHLALLLVLSSSTAWADQTLAVCERANAQWQPVGAATEWKAGKPFNVLLSSDKPFATEMIGFVIQKQDESGHDAEFIWHLQVTLDHPQRSTFYATRNGFAVLPEGRYSVYAVDWATYAIDENGNLSQYLARTTLNVAR